jgi:hypothetical protein
MADIKNSSQTFNSEFIVDHYQKIIVTMSKIKQQQIRQSTDCSKQKLWFAVKLGIEQEGVIINQ